MSNDVLEQLLRQGEDSITGFMGGRAHNFQADPADLAKAIGALANTRGGLLLLGVEDDGTVSGTGVCYVRHANRSREATREELVRLIHPTDYHFDEQPVTGATLDDLDMVAVRSFLSTVYRTAGSEENVTRYLVALKCLDRKGVPTLSGLLLFGQEPSRWLLDARISAVRIAGTQVTQVFADRQELEGRLLDQLEAACSFIQRNVTAPSRIEGPVRVGEGLPPEVVREAVVNAVIHRDYRIASQTRIFVFEDRVEIINPGELLNQLTLENIRQGGISQRRNPVLASLIARARRREDLGFGVPEMIRAMRERGFREPTIELGGGHFRLVLWLKREGKP